MTSDATGVRLTTSPRPSGRESGQATVEFALLLPVVAMMLLAVMQVGTVVRSRVMLTHAAREGARVAAVGGSEGEVRTAAVESSGLDPARLLVDVERSGGIVIVSLSYSEPTDVALIGPLLDDVDMTATAQMRRETPP